MGIDIELHLLFILFILAFALISIQLALFLVLIFFFVTLHELTHSVVAIKNKIRVRKIVLLPIGGMAMMESAEIKPLVEIKMSLAGPLMNLVIVYICLALAYIFSLPLGLWMSEFFDPAQAFVLSWPEMLLFYSFYANLILGVFNLLVPAFPLDGGRILRALLALRLEYVRASRIAKNLSLLIAGAMFLIAFAFGEIWIMIISFFIAFGAMSEFESMVVHRSLMRVKTRQLLSTDYLEVKSTESVSSVIMKMLTQKSMSAIIKTKEGIKVVSLANISAVPKKDWGKRVGPIAKSPGRIQLGFGIETIIRKMDKEQMSMLPVFDGKRFVGVVKRMDIERAVKIIEVLEKR